MKAEEMKAGMEVEWYDLGYGILRGVLLHESGWKARMSDGYVVLVPYPERVHPIGTLDRKLHAKVVKALSKK